MKLDHSFQRDDLRLQSSVVVTALTAKIAISDDLSLSETRRRDLLSALSCLCRALKQNPKDVVLSPALMRGYLKNVIVAVLLGVKEKRAKNLRADLTAVVDSYVLPGLRASGQGKLTPQWVALRELAGELKDVRYGLVRFMRFCSVHGVGPTQVTQVIFTEFCEWLDATEVRKNPTRCNQLTRNTWNRAVRRIQGWPQIILDNPRPQERYVRQWKDFPPTLCAEAVEWIDVLRKADVFDERAPTRRLREVSLTAKEFQLRQIASAMVEDGVDIQSLRSFSDLIRPENAQAAFSFMRRHLGKDKSSQMSGMAATLSSIAKHWLKADEIIIRQLKQARKLYQPNPLLLSSKNRQRLAQFKDLDNLLNLVRLPGRLAAAVKSGRLRGARAAYALEAALLIEIELMFPIRLKNLTELTINDQIRDMGSGTNRRLTIMIQGEEVKNSVQLTATLARESLPLYDLYLEKARPYISSGPSIYLFPSSDGKLHRNPANLSKRVSRTVKKWLGLDVNVHGFRHISALIYLTAHVGDYESMRRILGHTNIETLVKYYADLEIQPAIDRLHDRVLKLRSWSPGDGAL